MAAAELAIDERWVAGERNRRLRDVVPRLGDDEAPELVALRRCRGGADQHPVPARLVDRLDDELLDVLEDVGEIALVGRVVGGHVLEDRFLTEVEADHLRHERVDRLVVGDACTDRVRKRHVSGPVGVHQAGHAEQAVFPEGERVEEVVVDPPVDHVDAHHPVCRTVKDAIAVDDEIATLDDLDPHLTSEERVLEVGRVVCPRGQEDDTRVATGATRGNRTERLEQRARVLVDRANAVAIEERGKDAFERLAAFEHVADTRRRAQVVLEHEVAARAVPDQIDAADVCIDAAGDIEADHLASEIA